jgi:preprotein translocase subunit SecA
VARRARGTDGLGLPPGPDPSQLATNRPQERPNTPVTGTDGPGRNEPCPCGSGKKYKKCHGRAG